MDSAFEAVKRERLSIFERCKMSRVQRVVLDGLALGIGLHLMMGEVVPTL